MSNKSIRSMNRLRTTERIMLPIGLILAVGASVWLYFVYKSIWLSLFVFIMVSRFLLGSFPKILHHSRKVYRTLFYMLWPAGGTLVLYLTYQWWGKMWLSALLGLILGMVISVLVGAVFFREVATEDQKREEKVADFLVDEQMGKNPDAEAMKNLFSSSEWEEIKLFPSLILGMVALTAPKGPKPATNVYANAIVKPEKYKDPLFRMMLIDASTSITKDMGYMDGITRLSTGVTDKLMKSDFERLSRSGKMDMSQEGLFSVKPEAMHTIKDNLSTDEFRSFVRALFQFAGEMMNAGGNPDSQQYQMVIQFFSTFAESKEDLFAMLGVKR